MTGERKRSKQNLLERDPLDFLMEKLTTGILVTKDWFSKKQKRIEKERNLFNMPFGEADDCDISDNSDSSGSISQSILGFFG